MKLLNYRRTSHIKLGLVTEQGIIDVQRAGAQLDLAVPASMEEVMAQGPEERKILSLLLGKDLPRIPLEEVTVCPVIAQPEKILCIGLNYRDHAAETNIDLPTFPVVFSKYQNALATHGQEIAIPANVTQCDYEAELVVIIGREAADVPEEQALDYVFGYTVGNDLSARDLQFLSSQWLLGKTCDGFAPAGPYVTTADEVDPTSLEICSYVNGEQRQHSNTSKMIFSVARLISLISKYLTLRPGDLLFTGTPEGVILGRPENDRVWLKSGDRVSVTIQGLGTLENILK